MTFYGNWEKINGKAGFRVLWVLLVIGISLIMTGQSHAEVHIANDFSFVINDTTGDGKDQSSLTEGLRYLNIFGLNGGGTISDFDYHFNVGTRLTDDRSIDTQSFLLTNASLRLNNETHAFNVGDTFRSFSQYALSTSLKGGSYRYFDPASALPEIVLVYGYANPRWDHFEGFGESRIDALMREVSGAKISKDLFENLTAGISVVKTNDNDRVRPEDALHDILAYTLDWEYNPIPGLNLSMESSFSDATITTDDGNSRLDLDGRAHKVTAVGDGGPSRVTLEYERVSPYYSTVVGAATPDREKCKARWRYKATPRHTVSSGFLWYRDDVKDIKDFRTDHFKPEISLTTRQVFDRKYASTDISYKMDITRIDNDRTARRDQSVNLNYRDRFGMIDTDTNLGVSSYDIKETVDDQSYEYIYNTSLNTRMNVNDLVFKPSLNLGGWTFRKELEEETDRMYEYALGLGVDAPRKNITSNMKMGQNKYLKDQGDDSSKLFARINVFYRPASVPVLDRCLVFLRAYVNDFDYDAVGRDFRENSLTMGMNIQL